MEEYYYHKLNKTCQAVYHAMEAGLREISAEIPIPRVSDKELADIFLMLRLDHPDLFWASGFRYRFFKDSPNIIFVPEYLFEKAKIIEHRKAMQARVARLAKAAAGMSEFEKEKYIHDFICENITYDKLKKPYSHEIIGALGQGVSVCEGIAKAVKVLCDALGLWCMIAISGNNPEKGIKYRHTWNIVRIGGTYYHLDATFDNTLGKSMRESFPEAELRYDYFNIDDKAIFRDHEPLIFPAPACTDHGHFYYREVKRSFTKTEDVYKRSRQAAKKGRALTFHWRGGIRSREVMCELLDLMRKAGEEEHKSVSVSLNQPQAVITVGYSDAAGEKIVVEEANEGENC